MGRGKKEAETRDGECRAPYIFHATDRMRLNLATGNWIWGSIWSGICDFGADKYDCHRSVPTRPYSNPQPPPPTPPAPRRLHLHKWASSKKNFEDVSS